MVVLAVGYSFYLVVVIVGVSRILGSPYIKFDDLFAKKTCTQYANSFVFCCPSCQAQIQCDLFN